MKITATHDVSNVETFEDLKRFTTQFLEQTKSAINGGISIENLRAKLISFTVTQTSADIQVNHALGVIPIGYLKLQGPNISIYDVGKSTWTIDNIFVRASGTGDVTLLVMG